jgi:exodeoxyribonuclease III
MKIITWNCNMAFRKKAVFIQALKPDILIVPECEHPDKLKFDKGTKLPTAVFWHGTNLNKGIGIFSYSGFTFKLHKSHNPAFRHILPLVVTGGKVDFTLFAVWANNPADKDGPYITQVWKAIKYYDKLLCGEKIILSGDFNSNTIWDRPKREGNHSAMVQKLAEKRGKKNIQPYLCTATRISPIILIIVLPLITLYKNWKRCRWAATENGQHTATTNH